MTLTEYLNKVLESQALKEGSLERIRLRQHRADVEKLLRDAFPDSSPTIRYGGSVAKNTLIKDAYDLDIICYFEHDDETPGESLVDIYRNVSDLLSSNYVVQPKRSSLRLKGKSDRDYLQDFHIDVVPGRYTDTSRGDCYIHQTEGEKTRLKTNIDKHIEYIRDSGLTPIIRVMKLWNVQNGINLKTFGIELLVIEALKPHKSASLGDQFTRMLMRLQDEAHSLSIEDPANPTGNDLTSLLDDGMRNRLMSTAAANLSQIEDGNLTVLFGDVATTENAIPLASIVSSVGEGTRPWASE